MPHADLIELLDRWQPRRIVVAGDFMLDRYTYGHAGRLAPDAPVPVLTVQRTESMPGGAGNVCLDLTALRCDAAALGVVGDDEPARALTAALQDVGVDTQGLVTVAGRPTTVKQNIVGLAQHRHAQKMFRLDTEEQTPLDAPTLTVLLERAEALLDHADLLCLEDYNKGVLGEAACQGLIALARKRGVPVLVDPAAVNDYRKYRGATCVTPNRTEAQLATGETEPVAMARKLKTDLGLTHVVITLDKSGALLLDEADEPHPVATVARTVYDVTGAGDMVLATLAAARANQAPWVAAVELANVAAGLEVEKSGVAPVPLEELMLAVLQRRHRESGKTRPPEALVRELAAHRRQGKTIVFTNGCFDILHAGHIAYLRAAAKSGDLLVVGLNSDDSIRRLKGDGRPINHLADRLLVLSELESVDYLVEFDDDTPLKLIEAIRPDVLVKGADYLLDEVVGREAVEAHGGRVELIDLVEGRSTTNILRRLGGDAAPGH
ncbi:MAG: D-glycero-beta-D-manno-heptose 1-phosphate adenylyltransferase [Planctomycetota bacterium]